MNENKRKLRNLSSQSLEESKARKCLGRLDFWRKDYAAGGEDVKCNE